MNVTWDSRGSSKISERPCALLVILFWFHQPYPTFWSQECPGQDSDLEADLAKLEGLVQVGLKVVQLDRKKKWRTRPLKASMKSHQKGLWQVMFISFSVTTQLVQCKPSYLWLKVETEATLWWLKLAENVPHMIYVSLFSMKTSMYHEGFAILAILWLLKGHMLGHLWGGG